MFTLLFYTITDKHDITINIKSQLLPTEYNIKILDTRKITTKYQSYTHKSRRNPLCKRFPERKLTHYPADGWSDTGPVTQAHARLPSPARLPELLSISANTLFF